MLLGKVSGRSSTLLSGSSPKTPPSFTFNIPGVTSPYATPPFAPLLPKAVATSDDLSEVVVTAKKIPIPPAPTDEDIPEITVSARRIPWYAWAIAGVAGFAVLDGLLGRKR